MARGNRMRKSWVGATSPGVNLTTTQGVVLAVTVVEGSSVATLLRSRGNLFLSGTPDAAADIDVAAVGLIVVHTNALTAGGVSLPGPIADAGADWLWHQYVPLDASGATAGDPAGIGFNRWIEVDSKAMRRIPTDHAVVLMGELLGATMVSISVAGGVRFLFGN